MPEKTHLIAGLLILLPCMLALNTPSPNNNSEFCEKFTLIHKFLAERRQSDTIVVSPLGSVKAKSGFASASKSTHAVAYYESIVKLPGELASEFKKENGKFDYTVILGIHHSKTAADKAGKRVKAKILECVDKSLWNTSEIDGSYLVMNYQPRDISLALMSIKNASGKFEIRLIIITFGNL